ncbi:MULTISPECIES: transporter substrate-binding domain-containing protein [Geomicrobium]|uniref:Polar amino acid transport system substrate-binding protein n=1 Tax=Geomicrobium sediminis TaxID=1347788 RepID=A0ABS2PH65_9BACL|nr:MULTISPECIES: transporter substrate-binding domain-containing protein [Geomicrobium]MBM7634775.1 polar amino acid transport system substrate-binding protein [Geomicrobium sediminis]GAK10045.1 probable amino acid ABC transporter protein, solute-binding component [Geomicrobium sp. JCM 19038]
MRKFGLILFPAAILALAACGTSTSVEDFQENGVTLGVANEEPYGYIDTSTDEATGASAEIARAVFERMGVEVIDAEVSDWDNLIPSLNAGNYDVVTAGMDVQPERCENASFGDIEYSYGEGMAVQAGNPMDLHSYEDAVEAGATISVMSGANQFGMLEAIAEEKGLDPEADLNIMPANDIPGNIAAVESGDADVTVMTDATMNAAIATADENLIEQPENFTNPVIEGEEQVAYGAALFRSDDDELREAYNEALADLQGSDEFVAILEEFGFSADNVVEGVTTEDRCNAGGDEG